MSEPRAAYPKEAYPKEVEKEFQKDFKNKHKAAMEAINALEMKCPEEKLLHIRGFLLMYNVHPSANESWKQEIRELSYLLACVQNGDEEKLISGLNNIFSRFNATEQAMSAFLQRVSPSPGYSAKIPEITKENVLKYTQALFRERLDKIFSDLAPEQSKTLVSHSMQLFEVKDPVFTPAIQVLNKVKDLFKKHDHAIQWKWEGDNVFNGRYYSNEEDARKAQKKLDKNGLFAYVQKEEGDKGYRVYIPIDQVLNKVKDLFKKHDHAIKWKREGEYVFNGSYYINEEDARKAQKKLDKNGLFAYVQKEEGDKGYRVYIPIDQEKIIKWYNNFFNRQSPPKVAGETPSRDFDDSIHKPR